MFQRISTNTMNWILIIGIILFIIEFTFFKGGLIITAIVMGCSCFVGWKNYRMNWGKIVFWFGLIFLIISILNMNAVRFVVVVFLILFLIDYSKTKNKVFLQPGYGEGTVLTPEEPLLQMNPFFKQILYGNQESVNQAYEWKDINIQGGIGDRVIDLGNAVILQDVAVISIRHGIGNIIIYIPYDVEFMMHHSAIIGRAYILHRNHSQLFNQHIAYKTSGYDTATTKVKIITSLVSGNIEVKRI